jgi:molecular chaperone GrpE
MPSRDERERKLDEQEEVRNQAVASGEDLDLDAEDDDGADFPDFAAQAQELMQRLERVDELERELNDSRNKLGRLLADFENYRRRTSEDVLEAKGRGEVAAIESVLPVLDDLNRAIDAANADPSALLPGIRSTRDNFLKTLAAFGVEMVPGKGEPFDPHVHEALSAVPGEQDGIIAEVYQPGFTLRGKLVRPARVVVTRA